MKFDLYTDSKEIVRVKTSKAKKLVADFFETEMNYIKNAEEILETIKKLKKKDIDKWEETGDEYTLTLINNKVIIENDYTDKTCEISFDDFKYALIEWINFHKK